MARLSSPTVTASLVSLGIGLAALLIAAVAGLIAASWAVFHFVTWAFVVLAMIYPFSWAIGNFHELRGELPAIFPDRTELPDRLGIQTGVWRERLPYCVLAALPCALALLLT
jgi:hypothetical protein